MPYFILYSYCQDQYIMGPNGPVSLSIMEINQAMNDYNVDLDERMEFSLTVRRIAGIVFSARAEEAERERKRNSK